MKTFISFFAISAILGFYFIGCQNATEPTTLNTLNKFDEFGYNYDARLFNGLCDGADRNLDGTYWGDPTYAFDKLNMKWSKAWDDARFNGEPWTPEAWTTNHWNGQVSGGSGEIWHYKIIWVGSELENSEYWVEGGYAIWGQFEVIFSQGTIENEHFWEAHATPSGLMSK